MKEIIYIVIQTILFGIGSLFWVVSVFPSSAEVCIRALGSILQLIALFWFADTFKALEKRDFVIRSLTALQDRRLFWAITAMVCLYPVIVIDKPIDVFFVWPGALIAFAPMGSFVRKIMKIMIKNSTNMSKYASASGVSLLLVGILFQIILDTLLLSQIRILGPIMSGEHAMTGWWSFTMAPAFFAMTGSLLFGFGQKLLTIKQKIEAILLLFLGISLPSVVVAFALATKSGIHDVNLVAVYQLLLFFAYTDLEKATKIFDANLEVSTQPPAGSS